MANVIQTFPAGAGSGHTILDSTGTAVAQEKNLKITGLDITDNPTGESTDLAPAGLNQDSIDDIAGASLPSTILAGSGFNYSTTEQIVGRWVDGKPIYQMTVNFGAGPAAGLSKTVQANIANIDKIVSYKGISISSSGSLSLPFVHPNGLHYAIQLDTRDKTASKIDILVNVGTEMSLATSNIYVTIQYTKTTD